MGIKSMGIFKQKERIHIIFMEPRRYRSFHVVTGIFLNANYPLFPYIRYPCEENKNEGMPAVTYTHILPRFLIPVCYTVRGDNCVLYMQ